MRADIGKAVEDLAADARVPELHHIVPGPEGLPSIVAGGPADVVGSGVGRRAERQARQDEHGRDTAQETRTPRDGATGRDSRRAEPREIVLRPRSARAAACRVVHRDPTHPVPKTDHGRGRAPISWTQTYVRLTRFQPRASARRVSGTACRVTPVRMIPTLDPLEDRPPGLGLATGGSCIRHAPCRVVGRRGQRPQPALHPDPQQRDMRPGAGRLRRSAAPPQPPRNWP